MLDVAKKFEESMKELEEIVEKLESGEASLEEALNYFEAGINLSNSCRWMRPKRKYPCFWRERTAKRKSKIL